MTMGSAAQLGSRGWWSDCRPFGALTGDAFVDDKASEEALPWAVETLRSGGALAPAQGAL